MNPYDIMHKPGHRGKFTQQFKNRKKEYRHIKSLKAYSHYILRNPKTFNKITVKRARFYKNLLE
jgi:hypothetical protein